MCDPLTIGLVAVSAAQTGMSIKGQQEAAKQQERAQEAASEREAIRFGQEMTARRVKEAQDNKIAANEVQSIIKKTREAKATARVAAGEAGVTGASVQQLLDDFERQEAQAMFAISEQQSMGQVNTMLQDKQSIFASENKLAQINQPIQQPDYLGAAMNLAGSVMSIQAGAQQRKLNKAQLEQTGLQNQLTQTQLAQSGKQNQLLEQQLELNKRKLTGGF